MWGDKHGCRNKTNAWFNLAAAWCNRQKYRNGEIVTADNLSLLCKLLNCQPGDILEYVPDAENNTE